MVTRLAGGFLQKHRKLSLDTSVFIYFIERHPRFFDICDWIFHGIEERRVEATTSTLTLTEILVQPYKLKNDELVYR